MEWWGHGATFAVKVDKGYDTNFQIEVETNKLSRSMWKRINIRDHGGNGATKRLKQRRRDAEN